MTGVGSPPEQMLLDSPLMQAGGVDIVDGLLDATWLSALTDEALGLIAGADGQESSRPDHADWRGGHPPRRLLTSGAGPVQDALYRASGLAEVLSARCGLPLRPSGDRGSYSYYARPGDFLGLHRDIATCDVTVLTVLHDEPAADDAGGTLVVYPGRMWEPLSAIRARPADGALGVRLGVGQTALLLGGVVPHQVLPTAPGQVRIVSVLCFCAGHSFDPRGGRVIHDQRSHQTPARRSRQPS